MGPLGDPHVSSASPLAGSRIAIVGSGVMAEAIIAGLLREQIVDPGQLVASHPRSERRDELAERYAIRVTGSNEEAAGASDIVVLAIKPQMLDRVGRPLGAALRDDQLVLSVIAGATKPEQVRANVAAASWAPTEDDLAAINRIVPPPDER